MVNTSNMNEELRKIIEIINDHKNKSNKDLIKAMDYIKIDFDKTKDNMLVLDSHLSKLESTYNVLLKEYKKRTDGGNISQ